MDSGTPDPRIHDDDLSIAQYARRHHLSSLYLSKRPLSTYVVATPPDDDLHDEGTLPQLQLSHQLPIEEKWSFSTSGARYLQSITSLHKSPAPPIRPIKIAKQHKLELPLLRTDPDVDLAKFMHIAKRHTFKDYLEAADVSNDVAMTDSHLQWPLGDKQRMKHLERVSICERLAVPMEAAMYLRSITSVHSEIGISSPEPVRRLVPKPNPAFMVKTISPPLLPLSPSPTLRPASPPSLGEPTLTSTPVDPAVNELAGFENQLFKDDRDLDMLDLESAVRAAETYHCVPSVTPDRLIADHKRGRSAEFKMESPLLPLDCLSSPFKRTKLVEDALEQAVALLPVSPDLPTAASPDQSYDNFFNEMVDLAAPAEQALAAEQLDEADSTMRLRVPDLPWPQVIAPWLAYSSGSHGGDYAATRELASQCKLLSDLKDGIPKRDQIWKLTGQDRLVWKPIPTDHLCDIEEKPLSNSPDRLAMNTRDTFENLAISDDLLVWKPDGLRVLDVSDGDSEAEDMTGSYIALPGPAPVVEPNHALELDEGDSWLSANHRFTGPNRDTGDAEPRGLAETRDTHGGYNGLLFSATDALDSYMRVQAGRK